MGLPPARPRGWIVGPPEFIGIGAQRSGTTWWYGLICDHPEVHPAYGKELHFFDRYRDREFTTADSNAYHAKFPRPSGSITGEWTPRYMHDFWAPPLLRAAAPEARLIVLLRDPWKRFRSGVTHETAVLSRRVTRAKAAYVQQLMLNDALSRSLYADQLERLLDHFERSKVLVLQYERCLQDPVAELERTYAFLGLDPSHRPSRIDRTVGRVYGEGELPAHFRRAAARSIARDAARLPTYAPEIDLDLWPDATRSPRFARESAAA